MKYLNAYEVENIARDMLSTMGVSPCSHRRLCEIAAELCEEEHGFWPRRPLVLHIVTAARGLYRGRVITTQATIAALESEAPSYTCPRCHRGCMKSTDLDGDWHQMECPDCGHEEESEAV